MNVETTTGRLPRLPYEVPGVYRDGAKGPMVRVLWPSPTNNEQVLKTGTYTVLGSVPGTTFTPKATVTVKSKSQEAALPQRQLDAFPLGSVILTQDEKGRDTQFIKNRDKFVRALADTNPDRFLYNFRNAFGEPQPEEVRPLGGWDSQTTRLRGHASGHYLSIEHLTGQVEVIPVEAVWMSPLWTLEAGSSEGGWVIRNAWHTWQVLSENEAEVLYDQPFSKGQAQSEWRLEAADGGAVSLATPIPPAAVPTAAQPVGQRGAAVPWVEYEAEAGITNAKVLESDRTFGTFSAESSGRRAVQLNRTGDFVQFRSVKAANSIVVRYIIPDSDDGAGLNASLSLYVNGEFRTKLQLTSKYSWSYGGEQFTFNTPKAGGAHHFYDEARLLIDDIPSGAMVKLQKDVEDTADFYVIDLVDLEQVAPPKTMPEGYVSIEDLEAASSIVIRWERDCWQASSRRCFSPVT